MQTDNIGQTQKLAYGINDVVTLSSLSRAFIYEQIKDGRLKIFKVGKRTLIMADDLKGWLESHRSV